MPESDNSEKDLKQSIVRQATTRARSYIVSTLLVMATLLVLFPLEHFFTQSMYERSTARLLEAQRIAGDILLFDEQLTMSARLAVGTGDPAWIERHDTVIPRMDEAIVNAQRLAPEAVADRFDGETRMANDELVRLETEAFAAIRAGNLDTAHQLITSNEYRASKQILSQGSERFVRDTIASLSTEVSQVSHMTQGAQWLLFFICMIAAYLIWRRLNKNIDQIEATLLDAERDIQNLARQDILTGLPNRIMLKEHTLIALKQAQRNQSCLTLLMINLDRFKAINDRHGHAVGDQVLREIAKRLQSTVRENEILARYGSDVFVLVADCSLDMISILVERIHLAVSDTISIKGKKTAFKASIGYAGFPTDANTYDELIRRADVALHTAKTTNRGSAIAFNDSMDRDTETRMQIEEDLRIAIEQGDIQPYYQPLVNLESGRLEGFEVLARWIHPEKGIIGPDQFIPIAENAGLVQSISKAILRTACREFENSSHEFSLAINLSPDQFLDPITPEIFVRIARGYHFPIEKFEVELTESALLADLDAAKLALGRFKGYGIRVALDDFGTGYSSLSYLSELAFDKIKIDRSFIMTMHASPQSHTIIQAVISLARSLQIPTVAEGIESGQDVSELTRMGCNVGQGYYYSKPVPAPELPTLIKQINGAEGEKPRLARKSA